MAPIMEVPAWPLWMRRSQASFEEKFAQRGPEGPCRQIAQLMAGVAAIGLDDIEPAALIWSMPLRIRLGAGRIRSSAECGASRTSRARDNRAAAALASGAGTAFRSTSLPGCHALLGRIHQAIAAHPDAVGGLGQIGNDETAAIVGDHDLGELGGKLCCLGDHPDAGFGPLGPVTVPPISSPSMATPSCWRSNPAN